LILLSIDKPGQKVYLKRERDTKKWRERVISLPNFPLSSSSLLFGAEKEIKEMRSFIHSISKFRVCDEKVRER